MYDILSNHKVVNVKTHATQTTGTAVTTAKDLMEVAENGLRERSSRGLLVVFVTAVNTTGDITLTVQDSNDDVTYDADFVTLTKIEAAGVYIADLKGIRRYFKISSVCADANVDWGAILITFDAERKPVKQSDTTELTVTYGSSR